MSEQRSVAKSVISLRSTSLILGLCLTGSAGAADADKPLVFFVSDQLIYEDNLFRLSEAAAQDPLVQERDDYINRLSAGVRARMHMGRQDLLFNVRIDDVRFRNNDQLDYTGGLGNLVFNWELGSLWSGRVTADYQRSLASYRNYRFLARDVVTTAGGELEARFKLGPSFALVGGGRVSETDHSDVNRRGENFERQAARAGLEYSPRPGDSFTLEYRYLEGAFPDRVGLSVQDVRARDYDEDLFNLRVDYELTPKLHLLANLGHVERHYPFDASNSGFSGEVWRGTFEWRPRTKLGFDLSAWHELKAYIDAESNYFVADGASFGPSWKPLEKIEVALEYIYEEQDYIGTPTSSSFAPSVQPPILVSDPTRQDEVQTARLTAAYAPREFIELSLVWAYEERDSNRAVHVHDGQLIGMDVRIVF